MGKLFVPVKTGKTVGGCPRVGVTGSAKLLTASETRHGPDYFFFLDFTATFLPFFTVFFLAAIFTSPRFPL